MFRPDTPKRQADIVNLGYVVNVIEDPAERIEALVDSYRHRPSSEITARWQMSASLTPQGAPVILALV